MNGPILVHCRSGKDRTGMALAAYLIAFKNDETKVSMDKVLKVRPIAFSAQGWMDIVFDVLSHYETHNKGIHKDQFISMLFVDR